MFKYKFNLSRVIAVWACAMVISDVHAAKTFEITGKVQKLTARILVIEKDGKRLEFTEGDTNVIPQRIKPGDEITIWYTMNANKKVVSRAQPKDIQHQSEKPGEAGQADQEGNPEGRREGSQGNPEGNRDSKKTPPGTDEINPKDHIILDDRVFYDA